MYTDEIQKMRNQAHETNVANKIMDLLENLKLNSNDNSSRRWVWELIQNAKDVVNSTGNVDINISFEKDKNTIKFEHNGRLFSTKNLVHLIEQTSTKDRENIEGKKGKVTGKFGTGFLTTHLLSEKVSVSGILKDEEKPPREFEVELDRSGKNKTDIINSIKKSYEQLNFSQELKKDVTIRENEFNTTFTYKLNDSGIEVAKNGLDDLYFALPYVFSFVPELATLSVDTDDRIYKRGTIYNHENLRIYEVICIVSGEEIKKYICVLKKEDVSVATEVILGSKVCIQEYPYKIPRIFCDFPLVGTEDFSFPVVINSPNFNPTEPRDGIFLKDNQNPKIDENKALINKALDLYIELLDYVSKKDWQNIYNIVKIRPQNEKLWLSKNWLRDNIIEKCKVHITQIPIVDIENGERKALYDLFDQPEILIISDDDAAIREKVWDLAACIMPSKLTRRSEIHNWNNSLWDKCKNFSLNDLVIEVAKKKTIQNFSKSFADENKSINWLNELYKLISNDKKTKEYVLNEKVKIFPNQNGELCSFDVLRMDSNIDEIYKDILNLLDTDCRNKLIDREITIGNWIIFEIYTYENVFSEIKEGLQWESDKVDDVYKHIACLYDMTTKEYNDQIKLINFVNVVFPDYLPEIREVNELSVELLEDSMKYLSTRIADKISSYGNISTLSDNLVLSEGKIIEDWLVTIIEYLVKKDYYNLLNKKKKPILPNQNGVFKTKDELFLDSGEIDEVLKDISYFSGNDIREQLLNKNIYLELPKNRTKEIEDIAPDIIKYVKSQEGSKGKDALIKNSLKEFYFWLCENQEKTQIYFSEVWKNKHWLFDDYEIAENMKKAEVLDDILKKHNIQDINRLEEILNKNYDVISSMSSDEKEEISEELLIQSGIYTEEALNTALSTNIFRGNFVHNSERDEIKFRYVTEILERSKKNVIDYLKLNPEFGYDFSEMIELDKTIFLIKKHGSEMYLIVRPSDYKQVILYYDSEKDILDYEKDWELWVENGHDDPEKITFGKMLKLTGINKIPLKRVR